MNLCFLANNPRKDTSYGINRYAFELVHRIKKKTEAIVLSQGDPNNPIDLVSKELSFTLKVAQSNVKIYHALSQQLAKAAIITRKRPLVTTIHDLIPFTNSLTAFYQRNLSSTSYLGFEYMRLCTMIAAKSDIIIAPFKVTRKDLISILNVSPKKIRLISYGVDTEFFKPLNLTYNETRKKQGKKIIFFIGGFAPGKGADTLMKAFSRIIDKNQNFELWICGKWNLFDGIALAKQLGILDHIKILGYIPEQQLPLFYNLADLVVLPYKIGFSLPVLESMACRKAVITSDTPDLREIVGGFVKLVDPTDVEKLAEAMNYLLTNDSVRNDMAQRAYHRAQSLSWDNVAKKTMDVYSELS